MSLPYLTDAFRGITLHVTLALAETQAVIARLRRERVLAEVLIDAAVEALEKGPWHLLHIAPAPALIRPLAHKWPLRGAGFWQPPRPSRSNFPSCGFSPSIPACKPPREKARGRQTDG